MATVKVTDQALADAQRMLGIVNNQLPAQFTQLKGLGTSLSDANNWDGPLAIQFRGQVWESARSNLERMETALKELQTSVQKILSNISRAGGGA